MMENTDDPEVRGNVDIDVHLNQILLQYISFGRYDLPFGFS